MTGGESVLPVSGVWPIGEPIARVRGPLATLIFEGRTRRGLSQDNLATLLRASAKSERRSCEATRQTVHNWEAKGQVPHPETLRWLSAVLVVPMDELVAARRAQMNLTRRQLLRGAAVMGGALLAPGACLKSGMELLGRSAGADPWRPAMADPDQVLTYLRQAFGHFDTADWLFGPQLLLSTVDGHLALVQRLLSAATGPVRADLLTVGTRYAEFASWVNQDGGNMPAAGRWADLALEWAHEAQDSAMVSYVLMRKSSQAAVAGDTGRTIGLAQVAQQQAGHVPSRVRAVAAQQEAHGHALAGDEMSCHRKLDEAMELAAGELTVEGPGRYCIPEFLEIQRATCWVELGRPDQAVSLFEEQLTRLPSVHRRDRGVYLARLARAYAARDDADGAAINARQALDVVTTTGSRRIVAELAKLQPRLEQWRDVPGMADLHTAVAGLC
jgi:transcriptional regulator with XRE-family HTH domain